jgi:hypothetical protein
MTKNFMACIAVTAAVLVASAAQAQQAQRAPQGQQGQRAPQGQQTVCAPRAIMVEKLKADFGEKPRGVGLADTGGLIEFLASKEGSWTLIMTSPEGRSCLVMAGDKWKAREAEKGQGHGQASARAWPEM